MNFSNEHIDELIGKYLAGEATPEEAIWLDDWRQQSLENERHFAQLEKLFCATNGQNEPVRFNPDKAWKQVESRIKEQKQGRVIPLWANQWRVAASVAALVAFGAALFFILQPSPMYLELASTDRILTDTLPQGDIVHLNRQSTIHYAYHKRQKTAHIDLTGEAFFDLRNPDQTTVVKTGNLMIRDIGTKFNVQHRTDRDTIHVSVLEGEVQLYTEENEGIAVKAGETGWYLQSTRAFEKFTSTPSNELSWKTRNFHFNNATLREVAQTLNAVYDTRFIIEQPIENCRITVQFYNEQPEQIAEVIAETLGLEVVNEENKITFKGLGCAQ